MRIIALVGLSCALLAGSAAIGQASAAAAHPARPSPAGPARPVAGPIPGVGMPADSPGQECFFTFPNCMSGDPTVAFTMNSFNDSTGCTFQQDTEWGDGSHTTRSYNGGKNGTALVTFQHLYSAPGVYQISWTIVVQVQNGSDSCNGGPPGSLQFTLPAPPDVSCQSAQFSTTPMQVPVNLPGNPLQLSYGPASLSFGAGKTSGGSLCTMPP
ncbi:MAG TPA: hypothetical protein VFI65_06935, partial [Streptosporangiaceae bacterium]|nr:hypothetical protein [Streptosporangiaceae bacterium]